MTHRIKYLANLLVVLLFFASCGTTNSQQTEEISLTGAFESKMGVMHNISCYCFNVGFLETDAGEKVVVCFDKMEQEEKPKCSTIQVKGYYETKKIESDSNSPCPGGERKIFYVNSFVCKD